MKSLRRGALFDSFSMSSLRPPNQTYGAPSSLQQDYADLPDRCPELNCTILRNLGIIRRSA